MTDRLLTCRTELDQALLTLLPQAKHQIRLFDATLATFRLESPGTVAMLKTFLATPGAHLTMVLQDPTPLFRHCPRLQDLVGHHGHSFSLLQAPTRLNHLRDSFLLIDEASALIRFDRDQARGKVIDNEPNACRPYIQRFTAILDEGCAPISLSPLGL